MAYTRLQYYAMNIRGVCNFTHQRVDVLSHREFWKVINMSPTLPWDQPAVDSALRKAQSTDRPRIYSAHWIPFPNTTIRSHTSFQEIKTNLNKFKDGRRGNHYALTVVGSFFTNLWFVNK